MPTHALPRVHRWWLALCASAVLAFLALHAAYLTSIPFPAPVETAWGALQAFELVFFFGPTLLSATIAPPLSAAALLAVLVSRRVRRACLHGASELPTGVSVALRPWLHALLWLFLLVNHVLLDVDPYLQWVFVPALPLAFPERLGSWLARRTATARVGAWILVAALASLLATDGARIVGVGVLSLLLLPILALGTRLLARDRLVALAFALLLAQVAAALVPLRFPALHGGTLVGRDMAYSFCEPEGSGRLFAAMRRCGMVGERDVAVSTELARCGGSVLEYDAATLARRAEHRFFSESFFGRFEHIACLPDTVQVGMDRTHVDGRYQSMSLLEFEVDDPTRFRTNVLEESSGNVIAWDRRRGAVFYLSDDHVLVRRDLATGAVERDLIVSRLAETLSLTDIAVHEERDRLFVLHRFGWIDELDLDTLAVVETWSYAHGWELAIDGALDRLYVSGSFGLEVLDLAQRRITHRARLGLAGRRPAIDFAHDLLYVPSEGAGKLHVLDRRTLRELGSVPLGGGIRYPYVTADGRWLLATNDRAHFRWSTQALARRFRGR